MPQPLLPASPACVKNMKPERYLLCQGASAGTGLQLWCSLSGRHLRWRRRRGRAWRRRRGSPSCLAASGEVAGPAAGVTPRQTPSSLVVLEAAVGQAAGPLRRGSVAWVAGGGGAGGALPLGLPGFLGGGGGGGGGCLCWAILVRSGAVRELLPIGQLRSGLAAAVAGGGGGALAAGARGGHSGAACCRGRLWAGAAWLPPPILAASALAAALLLRRPGAGLRLLALAGLPSRLVSR